MLSYVNPSGPSGLRDGVCPRAHAFEVWIWSVGMMSVGSLAALIFCRAARALFFNLTRKKLTCTKKISYWKQIATIRQIIFFPTGNISLLSVKFSTPPQAAKIGELDALSSSLVRHLLDVVIDDKVWLLHKVIMLSPHRLSLNFK